MAWEFDRFLDKAADLDVYVQWNLQMQYAFQYSPFGYNNWDWEPDFPKGKINPGYCYRTDLGLEHPIDFFTSTEAKHEFKKKLRYYIARWGYSQNISLIELLSESNQCLRKLVIGTDTTDLDLYRHNLDGARGTLESWNLEMASYIKEDLNHEFHLLGTSFVTGGALPGDNTYSLPEIDVLCESRYTGYDDVFWKKTPNRVNEIQCSPSTSAKPVLWSEFGSGFKQMECSRPIQSLKNILLTPFGGTAGICFDWDAYENPETDFWEPYAHVSSFFSGLDLHQTKWYPKEGEIRGDKRVSLTYLRSDDNESMRKEWKKNMVWSDFEC